jgi:hypothetical protein
MQITNYFILAQAGTIRDEAVQKVILSNEVR